MNCKFLPLFSYNKTIFKSTKNTLNLIYFFKPLKLLSLKYGIKVFFLCLYKNIRNKHYKNKIGLKKKWFIILINLF
jgi:hypothetical protein